MFFLFLGETHNFFFPFQKKTFFFVESTLVRKRQSSNLESSKFFFYFLVFEKERGRFHGPTQKSGGSLFLFFFSVEETKINAPTYYKVALLEKYLVGDG